MNETVKFFCCYFICLLIVSGCWVGFEYIIDGYVHSSEIDGIVAAFLSWIIANNLCD